MSHREARGPGAAIPCVDGWLSSGPSPTQDPSVLRLHLLGAGPVGRAFLELLSPDTTRLVCVSDRSGSLYSRDGLDPAALSRFKRKGGKLAALPGASDLSLELALELVESDVVVDCTSTDPDTAEQAADRVRSILARGGAAVLAAKDALLHDASSLLRGPHRERVGVYAVLGGTGHLFADELDSLREDFVSFAGVPNASTSAVLDALGAGASLEEACDEARAAGLLENDARLDLDGTDAALKIAIVASALEGRRIGVADVRRCGLEDVGSDRVRRAARRGLATRLVARFDRGATPRVGLEEIPREALLAPSPRNVVYCYTRGDRRRRVHLGDGLGPEGTARALARDLAKLRRQGDAR